eukprot:TRINITY_DN18010_c0_g1_i2.p1 TRINITY_DN18010_c0_g1~~TRINITY_DN18010_c0_g1_i2.p1  ORF type:complete len:367 (-),score=68.36 TRINITY_DN18010_c0_g1_i2:267-1331(-)
MAAAADKPWRLSSSVVVLAPSSCVSTTLDVKVPPASQQDYRICFLKRAARASFMPDIMVFPGGAVDTQDRISAAELLPSPSEDAVLRCAAIREAFEESGIGIFKPPLQLRESGTLAALRKTLHSDAAALRSLCRDAGVVPDVDSLSYWCSFITPDVEHVNLKRGGFDARFYVWCAASDKDPGLRRMLSAASADAEETVALVWLSPSEALQAAESGLVSMAPPQWYIAHELAEKCPRLADVSSYAGCASRTLRREYPIKPYVVLLQEEEGAAFRRRCEERLRGRGVNDFMPVALCFPGDEAHPVFPGAATARHRMLMSAPPGKHGLFELHCNISDPSQLPGRQPKVAEWYHLAKL